MLIPALPQDLSPQPPRGCSEVEGAWRCAVTAKARGSRLSYYLDYSLFLTLIGMASEDRAPISLLSASNPRGSRQLRALHTYTTSHHPDIFLSCPHITLHVTQK